LLRGEHRVVLDEEVLPPEVHAPRRRGRHRVPGFLLVRGRALPVHVDDDREVVVAGVEVTFPRDHLQLELVQHQQLLRQAIPCGQRREPAGDAVDLADIHVPDLLKRCLPGL
jgi:hypothetical protein